MEDKKRYFLTINGQEIEVSEKVYREYIRPVRATQRQKRRQWRCKLLSKNGRHYVRCKEKCENCPYYLAGHTALGNATSLDRLMAVGKEYVDKDADIETDLIERETGMEEYENLHEAINKLSPRQQEILRTVYFEGKTQDEVARELCITQGAVSLSLLDSIKKLKFFMQNAQKS